MPPRGKDGKFVKNENHEKESFLEEMRKLFIFIYRLWRYSPLILVIWMIWKYFQIQAKAEGVLLELVCGANCTCSCKKDQTPSKGGL